MQCFELAKKVARLSIDCRIHSLPLIVIFPKLALKPAESSNV
jgi:hypothetical protein